MEMRFLLCIFSLYLLALTAMPCSDMSNNCETATTSITKPVTHNHQSDGDDACGPFCFCSCCSVSTNPKITALEFQIAKPITSTITYPVRDFSLISNYYGNIWQPPKING